MLGCLLEKQRTTPDQYPLSLNALRLACNQSTNREPVVDYDESTIRVALHRLERRGLVRLASGAGSRAAKYRHLLADALPMSHAEQALMCVLMLRGPQTPGELKQRAERMHPFGDLDEVGGALGDLIARGLVEGRGRRPGQKEDRYAQLLEGAEEDGSGASAGTANGASGAPAGVEDRGPADHGAGATAEASHGGAQAGPLAGEAPAAAPEPGGVLAELIARVDRLERQMAQLSGAPEQERS